LFLDKPTYIKKGAEDQEVKTEEVKPYARRSTTLFPSLKIWVTIQFIWLTINMTFFQRFFRGQATGLTGLLKAATTKEESSPNHRLSQFFSKAILHY
jgi:hypothetical protein